MGRFRPRTESRAVAAPTVIARQPVYDRKLEVVAYELLFRTANPTGERPADHDAATAEVLMSAFTDFGMNDLVGDHKAFVNVPYGFIVNGYCATLPKDRVVLEILEDVTIDDRVIRAVRELAAAGFTIALDDFEFSPELRPLLEVAHIIKFDVLALSETALHETIEHVRHYKAQWLAEKVEQRGQIRRLAALGFEYFQGYALERPTVLRTSRTGANRMVMVQVIADLNRRDIAIPALVDTISRDPELVYALLRIVNSASHGLRRQIASLHQALALLGMNGLRNWATMILMTRLSEGDTASLTTALVRAKMCEAAARELGEDPPTAFTVGLLSALPRVLGEPLESVVGRLSLDPLIEAALLGHAGPIGALLRWVLAYEAGDDAALAGAPAALTKGFLDGLSWLHSIERDLATDPAAEQSA